MGCVVLISVIACRCLLVGTAAFETSETLGGFVLGDDGKGSASTNGGCKGVGLLEVFARLAFVSCHLHASPRIISNNWNVCQ